VFTHSCAACWWQSYAQSLAYQVQAQVSTRAASYCSVLMHPPISKPSGAHSDGVCGTAAARNMPHSTVSTLLPSGSCPSSGASSACASGVTAPTRHLSFSTPVSMGFIAFMLMEGRLL